MAYRKPNDLDGFIQLMPKADMRVRGQLAEDLVTYLSDDTNSIVCMDLGLLVDGLMPWLAGSHFKIAQKSLEAFTELIKRLGPDFNAYNSTVLPHVIDRLGDSKDTVREKAQLLLLTLMEHKVLTPQSLVDKLSASCFRHKNAKVREEFLQTIVNTLQEYGAQQLSVKAYIQPICVLLGDPNVSVRDSAIHTLVEIFKHVGDRLRLDLRRKDDVPAAKLAILEQKFDQVRSEGLMMKSALSFSTNTSHDESDNVGIRDRPTKLVKRTVSASSSKMKSMLPAASEVGDAGAVTMEIFEASFELVPHLTIFHQRDIDDVYKQVLGIISDKTADWDKRVDALKKIRSLLILNIQANPQFSGQLKELSIAFLDILKEELRSQVIREACITIAYMSKTLRQKLDLFCIYILEQLINLIQNSAKVIASSSSIALKYIIKFTHAPKIINIITQTLSQSKSKDIRASLCEMLILLFEEWQTRSMDRYASQLRDALKKSICDADNDARRHSRRAFWGFRRHFPELADNIYGSIDIATQRALERERDSGGAAGDDRRAASSTRFQRSAPSLQKPVAASVRSVSAVDTAAAQRAKARAQYSNFARIRGGTTAMTVTGSLPRPKVVPAATPHYQQQQAMATPRTRGRAGVSQSQPGSRSTSPSSKLRELYPHYRQPTTGTIPKKASGIPRSLTGSRETSPTRSTMKRSMYSMVAPNPRRTPERHTNAARPLLAQKMLQQSREAETALADALSPESADAVDIATIDYGRAAAGQRLGRKLIARDESDDSEASSVCSERSFDSSYTRGNNSNYSWSGSRNRLDWSTTRAPFEDIDTIIQYCASTHWSERKDGLISLTQYLADGKDLTPAQLQCVLDMFRKMFMDTHTKVYALFLDAVIELILAHAADLHDWLFILLTRLFNKLGTELLGSMHTKIWKTLQVVHEYFPTELQVKDIFRILADSAQTPSTKTKIAILRFLTSLATTYCKNSDFPSEEASQLQVEKALVKIVQLSGDQKSVELRGQARLCLIALYNCNAPHMTKMLSQLPKSYQDSARTIIQSYLRRSSTSGTNSPSSSPLSSSSSPKPLLSPAAQAPFSSLQLQPTLSPHSRQSSVDQEHNSEEDVYKSLRKTTAEIQNYSFEDKIGRESSITRQFNSLSIDNGYNGHHHLHLQHEHHDKDSSSNSKTQSATTTESNTPESTTMRLDAGLLESQHQHKLNANTMTASVSHSANKQYLNYTLSAEGEIVLENGLHESEVIKIACTLTPETPIPQLQSALSNLAVCIKGGNAVLPNKHFIAIMKMLVNLLDAEAVECMIASLHVLSKIIRNEQMKGNWINFLELILLRIINCYRQGKDMAREIDAVILRIAPSLPINIAINILNPVIATETYPLNLCAVKLLTELVDRQGSELTEVHLDSVMPNLARLTDDCQSMVRKAAVFCIVKLYIVMGEDKVKPKFSLLNPSKIRLLNVYIDKMRGSSSVGGGGGGSSTKNSSASSS